MYTHDIIHNALYLVEILKEFCPILKEGSVRGHLSRGILSVYRLCTTGSTTRRQRRIRITLTTDSAALQQRDVITALRSLQLTADSATLKRRSISASQRLKKGKRLSNQQKSIFLQSPSAGDTVFLLTRANRRRMSYTRRQIYREQLSDHLHFRKKNIVKTKGI